MAEEEWIAHTQETLGKLISKPKMTEKYLKKPPFRFLHDIVMEVVRSTNFAQGLYTPQECDAAQLSDKGAKVEFLNKVINATGFALGEQVHVSASKIVAGLEADKTNAFLQKLHQAATTCVGAKSDDAVQRVLNGETMGGSSKEKKKKKEEEPKSEEAKPKASAGDDPEAAAAVDEEAKKKEEDRKRRAERKKKEEERKKKEEEAERAAAAAAEEAKAAGDAGAAAKDAEAEEEAAKKEKREEEKRKKEEERKRREEKKRLQAEAEEKQRQEQEAAAAAAAASAAAAAAEEERQRAAAAEAEHFTEMPSAPGSAAQPTRPIQGDEEAAAREAMLAAQRGGLDDDLAARQQARPERPRTAGRRPPKVQSKVQTSAEQTGGTANVQAPVIIAEGAKDDDDEDMFEQPANETIGFGMVKAEEGAQHGKLVSSLLAEKKKEEEKERIKKEEEETREEFEDGQSKGIRFGKLKRKKGEAQQQIEVDIGSLGTAIQSLCQAANPLGKSIDLVHQDITNMGKELDHWKQEHREASEMYQQQLKMTDELLQPLHQKVAELDDKIAEQRTKIRNSRSRISKNDLKIQGLLESVVCAK